MPRRSKWLSGLVSSQAKYATMCLIAQWRRRLARVEMFLPASFKAINQNRSTTARKRSKEMGFEI